MSSRVQVCVRNREINSELKDIRARLHRASFLLPSKKGCGQMCGGWGSHHYVPGWGALLSATVSAFGSCSLASGWGGSVKSPAGEKEAEVRARRELSGFSPPMSIKAQTHSLLPGKDHTQSPQFCGSRLGKAATLRATFYKSSVARSSR